MTETGALLLHLGVTQLAGEFVRVRTLKPGDCPLFYNHQGINPVCLAHFRKYLLSQNNKSQNSIFLSDFY
jgi:hypothetical protein